MAVISVHEGKCAGCSICEVACALAHFKVVNPKKSMIRIKFNFSRDGFTVKIAVCRLCGEKKCIDACPVGALKFNGQRIEVDEEVCTRCMVCARSCPYDSISFHPDLKRPLICDLCNGDPQCVKACPMEALKYVG